MSELQQAVEAARREVSALEAMRVEHANDEAQVLLRERDLLVAVVARLEAEVSGVPPAALVEVERASTVVTQTAGLCTYVGVLLGMCTAEHAVTHACLVCGLTGLSVLVERRSRHVS
jgi:hypothetical protein